MFKVQCSMFKIKTKQGTLYAIRHTPYAFSNALKGPFRGFGGGYPFRGFGADNQKEAEGCRLWAEGDT